MMTEFVLIWVFISILFLLFRVQRLSDRISKLEAQNTPAVVQRPSLPRKTIRQ